MNDGTPESLGVEKKRENWLKSEDKIKRYSSRAGVGVAGTAIIAGAIRGLALVGEKVVEKVGGEVIDPGEPMTTGKDLIESEDKYSADYQVYGLNDSKIAINLTNLAVVDRKLMQVLSAEAGGPGWILPVIEKDDKEIIPENADFLAEQLVSQLTETSKQEVLDNWIVWHNDQQAFLNFLQSHGANSTVINFWQCTLNLTKNDQTKDTWMDRVPGVQVCATSAKSALSGGAKHGLPKVARVKWTSEVQMPQVNHFNELAGRVDIETGGAMEQLWGSLETLGNMPIDTTAIHEAAAVDMAEFYQHESQKPLLANTGLPLILTGLFLLRVGPAWPKEVIAKASERLEDVYYWFKLGQPERAMRNLMVLGQQAWDRVTGKKD